MLTACPRDVPTRAGTARDDCRLVPPPPLPSRAFALHLLHGRVARRAVVSGIVSGGVRDHGSGPFLHAVEDQVGDGRRLTVHARDDMAVGLEGEATLAWPRRSLITLAEIPALSAAGSPSRSGAGRP
jgi:hypothetical protein